MRTGRLLAALLLLPGAPAAVAAELADSVITAPYRDLLTYRMTARLEAGQRRVELQALAIVPGSESVLLDGQALAPGRDYRLDFGQGALELLEPAPGALLEFSAERLPWGLPRRLELAPFRSWQELSLLADADTARAASGASPPSTEAGAAAVPASFTLGGSKSLVLRMGEGEDFALEQSLRVQLQGRLGDSTVVEAVLRDDNLPFQPEGNTERLDELDKVFLQIAGPAGRARVGDFVFEAPERELTPFHRDFQGIQGEWRGARGGAGLWLARSQGLFTSLEFTGSEGLQGPYELLSALRSNGAVILAGSETVRLNGRVLTRGRDRDYVIDYDQASVTFSSGQPVSEGDIIRVDFRYSQESWERGAWGASAGARLGALRVDLLHFEESDDTARPLAFGLDDAHRAALAAAGDDAALAITDGVIPRPGAGRYVLTHEDPTLPDLDTYAWVDSLGDYVLRFRELGAGQGDYRALGVSADGERYFGYAGQGQGSFALGEQLALPESYRLESLRLDWSGAGVEGEAELALSDRDANLLSSRDDGDNLGGAFRAALAGRVAEPGGQPLTLRASAERQEERFRFPGARRGASDYRLWNLPWDPGRLDERRLGLALDWGDSPWRSLHGGVESLSLGNRFDGLRGTLDGGLGRADLGLRAAGAAVSSSDSLLGDGSRLEGRLTVDLPLPLLRGAQVDVERARLDHPDSLDALRTPELRANHTRSGAELRFGARGGGLWSFSWREEGIEAGAAQDRVRRLRSAVAGGLPASGRLDLTAHYQRRRGSLDTEQFQAEARGTWLARPGGWGGDLLYRLGSQRQRLRQSRLVFVGLGLGDLNEDGVYVGEGEGDYRRLSLLAEEAVRTQNLELETRLQHLEARKGRWLSRLGSESRVTLREQNRDASPWALARLDPARFRRVGSTLLGSAELWQELRYRPRGGQELRYRFRRLARLDARDTAGSVDESEWSHALRSRWSGDSGSLEWTLRLERRERRGVEGGGGDYAVGQRGSALAGARHLPGRLTATLTGDLSLQRDDARALGLRVLSLEPGLALTPVNSLRLEARWQLSHNDYTEGDPAAGRPWFFDAPGWTRVLRLESTVQAGGNLTLSARYELREEADTDARQRLRLESRAFF